MRALTTAESASTISIKYIRKTFKVGKSDYKMSQTALIASVGRGENITLQDLNGRHPGWVCICRPHLRDAWNGRVAHWICLQPLPASMPQAQP